MKFSYIPLFAVLALAGCSNGSDNLGNVPSIGGSAPSVTQNLGASDIVSVGDKLEIYVLEDETFNGIYTVRDGGHIIFPKVGRVEVAGKSLNMVEATVKAAFEGPAQQLRKATIIVERHGARREVAQGPQVATIYLSGQVNRPGALAVPYIDGQQPTVYQAIVHGGGTADFAKLSKTYVIRNSPAGRQRIDVNLDKVGSGDAQDISIQNGDIIVVPQKGFLF